MNEGSENVFNGERDKGDMGLCIYLIVVILPDAKGHSVSDRPPGVGVVVVALLMRGGGVW
eukprot:6191291-Pleurochrysis_carterae.AAC.1